MGKHQHKELSFLEQADLHSFVKILKKNVNAIKKAMGKFEEPYSEMSQNCKEILIRVTLPAIDKKYLTLRILGKTVEVVAEQTDEGAHVKTLYRSIDLPSTADTRRATATYVGDVLSIKVPQSLIR